MKIHLKPLLVVFVLALLGVFGYIWSLKEKKQDVPQNSHLDIVEEMRTQGVPEVSAENIRGQAVTLSQYKGKIVIVNFWASWCGPCIEEIPSLIKLSERFKDQLIILAISADEQKEEIDVFKKSFPGLDKKNIEIIWDKDKSIMKQFNVGRLPESYIINKQQKLEKKVVGSIDWNTNESIDFFESLLSL